MAKTKSLGEQLYDASKSGSLKSVKALVAAGADVRGRTDYGGAKQQTPLHGAAASGEWEVVKYLMEHGGDLNAPDARGATPLRAALTGKYPSSNLGDLERRLLFFKKLVEHGADPRVVDGEGRTLLHFAASLKVPGRDDDEDGEHQDDGQDEEEGERLEGFDRRNPDAAAAWVVAYLRSLGLPIEGRTQSGMTPLHETMGRNNARVAKALLAAGAAVDARTASEATALHAASELSTATVLCEAGADVNAVNAEGNTPLHGMAGSDLDVAKFLIARGARLDVKNKAGKTPFDLLDGSDREWEALLAPPGAQSKRAELYALDERLVAEPDHPGLLQERGDAHFRLEKYDQAAEDYRRSAELDGKEAAVHFKLGQALSCTGASKAALPAFNRALELDAKHVQARLSRAVTFLGLHQYDRAVADAEEALRGGVSDDLREGAEAALARGRAMQRLAAMSPVQVTEQWYGVTLPAEYRAFLEGRAYEKYPAHRPRTLPSYGKHAPKVSLIYGRSVFGLPNGEGRFDPEEAEDQSTAFQLVSEVGKTRRVGDYLKQEVFSGLEFENYDDGFLDRLLPFALLGDGSEAQALAIDVTKPGCPILMYEHETGEFEAVAPTLATFLATLEPLPEGDSDDDD